MSNDSPRSLHQISDLNRFVISKKTFVKPILFIIFIATSIFMLVGLTGYGQNELVIERSKKVPPGFARTTEMLSKKLTENWDSDEDKFLALYTWVIHNIKYDVKQLENYSIKHQSSQKTLKRRKGVCQHYSSLLEELCAEADIVCKRIDGNIDKDLWVYQHSDAYHVADHSWNGVQLDGKWQLVDATFDAGFVGVQHGKFAQFLRRLGIPYVNPKLKFVRAPVYTRYNMPPDEMIIDHLPVVPFWQLLHDPMPIDSFRLSLGQKRAYLRNRVEGPFYNYKDSIEHCIFHEFPDQVIGYSCSNYNDTNDFRYGFGQERFVYESLVKYQGTKPQDLPDCELRYTEYDTLNYFVLEAKAAFKNQKSTEKRVHLSLLKKQKDRYKRVFRENNKIIAKTKSACTKNKVLIRKNKSQNKALKIKYEKLKVAIKKQAAIQLKQKEGAEEIPPRSELEKKLSDANEALADVDRLILQNDTLKMALSNTFNLIDQQMELVDSALINQIRCTMESEGWLLAFYARYDSIYLNARIRAQIWNEAHLKHRDSLLFLVSKKVKRVVGQHYKNLSSMKRGIKTAQSLYTELSPFVDVDELGANLLKLNSQAVLSFENHLFIYDSLRERNFDLNFWLEKNTKEQKELIRGCAWEKSTAGPHRRFNQRFERSRYLSQLKQISEHQHALSRNKAVIRGELKAIRQEIKLREQQDISSQ